MPVNLHKVGRDGLGIAKVASVRGEEVGGGEYGRGMEGEGGLPATAVFCPFRTMDSMSTTLCLSQPEPGKNRLASFCASSAVRSPAAQ